MKVIDTSEEMLSAFRGDAFDLERWGAYLDAALPGARELCLKDMRETVAAGYPWKTRFLPVLNAVARDAPRRRKAVRSFRRVTDGLDERILDRFGRTAEADVVLYLGLCSGAGWVTPVGGRLCVLLGIEKIMELGWCGADDMRALILHELGHVYHAQYGDLAPEARTPADGFLVQLFTEGTATVFEQEVLGDPGFFHQDRNGWKAWCGRNAEFIRSSFAEDLGTMTREDQRYFGDWVRLEGHGDTGYYLGARFVRFLLEEQEFDALIRYGMEDIRGAFTRFLRADLRRPSAR